MGNNAQAGPWSWRQRAVGAAVAAVAAAGTLGGVVAPSLPPVASPALEADGLLVRFEPGVRPQTAAALVAGAGGALGSTVPGTGYFEVAVDPGRELAVQRSLGASAAVVASEVNHVRRAFLVPNDLHYPSGQAGYLEAIHLPEAWELSRGDDNLVLAILDSGIDANHPDLAGRLVPGLDAVNGAENVYPFDDYGHGTAVAGVAAAQTNNGRGVAGVAWRGRIMPVKVIDHDGQASDAHIAIGMHWAVDHGADVINLSLGGPGASAVLQEAVDYAVSRGVVVVAAAGNSNDTEPNWPAAARNVIAVAATDWVGDRAGFSNYGPWLDLSAPGTNIRTTDVCRSGAAIIPCPPGPVGPYQSVNGTSFAAPLVAGVALLMQAADPGASVEAITDRLRRSARDVGTPGFDTASGAGLLDAAAAVRMGGFSAASGGSGSGYWMLGGDGAVYPFGAASYAGEPRGEDVVAADIEPMPSGRGYWVLADDGAVYSLGEDRYFGRVFPHDLQGGEEVTSLSATRAGDGYWIFTTRGRALNFGQAPRLGDVSGTELNKPVVDSILAPGGQGYYMVAADGGVFAIGAPYRGSLPEILGSRLPNLPVRSLVPDPDGSGYWLVAEDGGVFAFDAPYRGSLPAVLNGRLPNGPVTGMVPYGDAYLMVATDGGIFNFATNLAFAGSLGSDPPGAPVVAVAALPR